MIHHYKLVKTLFIGFHIVIHHGRGEQHFSVPKRRYDF